MTSFFRYLKTTYNLNKGFSGLSIIKHREIYNEWISQLKSESSPIDLELPWITIVSKNYIEEFLRSLYKPRTRVFEFGSGGSCLFFLKYSNHVISIEHDRNWFELVGRTV